jgi:PAS domain S-box-containing protein
MMEPAFLSLLHNASLLLALILVFDHTTSRVRLENQWWRQVLIGALIGGLGVALILSCFRLNSSVVFDTRSVLLSISGLFLGAVPTVIAMLITSLFRITQGGAALTGTLVIVATGTVGILWRRYRRGAIESISPLELLAFGIATHLVMLALMFTLPWNVAKQVMAFVAAPVMLVYPLATMAMGLLMANRIRREKVNAALTESEERYRSLFENNHATMLIIDPGDGTIVDANPAACRFYGWPREELQGMHLDKINTLPREQLMAEMSQACAAPRHLHFEFSHRRADGSTRNVEVFSGPISMGGKRLLYSIIHDITDRRKAERALKESHEMVLKLTAQIPGVVYQYRTFPDGRSSFPFSTHGMNTIYEVTPEDVREDATPVFGRLHPEDRDRILQEITESARTLNPFHCEFRVVLPRQGLRWRLSNAQPERLEDGSTLWHGIILDDTERKLAEQALQERNEELVRFVYTVSHDLKSPLVTIQTFLGYLEKDMQSGDAARINTDMEYIRRAASRMLQLLDELLELSRIGRKMNSSEDVTLQEIAQAAQEQVAGQIAERRARVEVTDLPLMLHGDRQRLLELFQNLLDNSVKFMGDQASPLIQIGAEPNEAEIVLFVKDNGSGIDPRHQGKLFGLFEKLHPGTPGSGIGLALVKRIVEVHGGRIWAESAGQGCGATFRFTLKGTRLL